MLLSQAAEHMQGTLSGNDIEFASVSTDSRSVKDGQLFFALSGPSFDGHEYLGDVQGRNACAAVVSRSVGDADSAEADKSQKQLRTILVDDVLQALGKLAQHWRCQLDLKVVALTGSVGKTSVKEMLASILGMAGSTHFTQGNLNNHIGAPLTLLELNTTHDYAVIELGASAVGEIAYIANITQADVALINNAAGAHIEGFGSIDNIALGKGEIYEALNPGGVAVINHSDNYFEFWLQKIEKQNLRFNEQGLESIRVFSFSTQADSKANVYVSNAQQMDSGAWLCKVQTPKGALAVELPILGAHNIDNMLAAISCALALNISFEHIQAGLKLIRPVKGRMFPHSLGKALLVDDSYNANEASVKAAIDYLNSQSSYRKILVLGDLAELGDDSAVVHTRLGQYAKDQGVDVLLGVGKKVSDAVATFGEGALLLEDHKQAVTKCREFSNEKSCILVKGSRSSSMDKIVDALLNADTHMNTDTHGDSKTGVSV